MLLSPSFIFGKFSQVASSFDGSLQLQCAGKTFLSCSLTTLALLSCVLLRCTSVVRCVLCYTGVCCVVYCV